MKRALKIILLAVLALAIQSCATLNRTATAPVPSSIEEAKVIVDAEIKYGVRAKDEKFAAYHDAEKLSLPRKAEAPIDFAAIKKYAIRKAVENPFSTYISFYNAGLLSKDQVLQLMSADLRSSNRERSSMRQQSNDAPIFSPGLSLADNSRQFIPPAKSSGNTNRPFSSFGGQSFAGGGGNGSIYDPKSIHNPYGAGSPYKADGLMNPYSKYGSPYSNKSWTNPLATDTPKLYDKNGKYLGRMSSNKYDPESISNPTGKYGNPYSSDSINNPYGSGNPYANKNIYIVPQR
jgi:hypothetical protein